MLISICLPPELLFIRVLHPQDSLIIDFVPVKAPLPNGGEFDETPKFELECLSLTPRILLGYLAELPLVLDNIVLGKTDVANGHK